MHRFYLDKADFSKGLVLITDKEELHHMKNVLRLKKGDLFRVFNGQHQEAEVVVESVSGEGIEAKVITVWLMNDASATRIILACAVPKKAKFEFIIEKCTELGVNEIIPLKTKRSDVIYAKEKLSHKQERFIKVAVNAAKQCKRGDIPVIAPMTDLKEVLEKRDRASLAIFPCLVDTPKHIHEVLGLNKDQKTVYIFIGPEGDFTPQEVSMAMDNGCIPVSLGKTVLKVDTAAIAAVAFIRLLSD